MKVQPVKSLWFLMSLVFLSVASAIITPLTAHADIFSDWVLYADGGTGKSEGYFSNNGASDTLDANRRGCGLSRCPVIPNDNYARDSLNAGYYRQGNLNTATSVARTHDLIYDLKNLYNSGGWSQSGAAFIINTMLGYGSDSPNKTRTISAAMWNEVENRLVDRAQKNRINWNTDFSSNGRDTYTRIINNQWDVVYDAGTETRNGIIIYNDSGAEVYRLWYSCANPVGTVSGLPAASWNISPSVSVNKTTATVGETITWSHTVRNNGPSATSTTVSSQYVSSGFPAAGGAAVGDMPAGTASGQSRTFTSVHVVRDIDLGRTLCRLTRSAPRSNSNSTYLDSASVCVRIVNRWTISATSAITAITGTTSKTIAKPGDTVTWTHLVRNDGPESTQSAVTYRYVNGTGFAAGSGAAQTMPTNTASGGTRSVTSTYVVTQADVNKTFCRSTSAVPRAWNDASTLTSAAGCFTVPYNYTLTPTITLDRSGVVEAPTSVNVTPQVTNGGPTDSRPTQWQLTRINVTANNTVPRPTGGSSVLATPPCSFFTGPGASCGIVSSGTSVFTAAGGVTGSALNAIAQQILDLPVGSKICFALSVQPGSSSSGNWTHSAPLCLIVGKKPKVQVWGSDLIVGRGVASPGSMVATGTSTSALMYGSWSEYGIVASGPVTGMASGAGYGGGITPNALCSVSLLTFANTDGSSCAVNKIGNYALASTAPNVAARFPVTAATPRISGQVKIDTLASGQTYTSNGAAAINLSADTPAKSTIPVGKWVVINAPDADVTISSNITYTTGVLASATDIPQFVIIAKNIIIADSVTQVDAWLVAKGTGVNGRLNTCGVGTGVTEATLPHAGQCAAQLRMNGPVIANHLLLRRTAGAGTGAAGGVPGEIFNLRPDAYIWAANYASGNDRLPTVSSKELPPRF